MSVEAKGNELSTGLYYLTHQLSLDRLLMQIDQVCRAGASLIQYRRKNISPAQQPNEINLIKKLCDTYHVPLLINDNVALAEQFGCGVHLGQQDGSIIEARQRLGNDVLIGRTCHNSLLLAQQALAQGANYVALGAVNLSATKPNATRVSSDIVTQAINEFGGQLCLIGGLTPQNAQGYVGHVKYIALTLPIEL